MMLAASMITAIGCTKKPEERDRTREEDFDSSLIESIPEDFVAALTSLDMDAIEDLVMDYDFDSDMYNVQMMGDEDLEIYMHIISLTSFEFEDDAVYDPEYNSAKIRTTISYIDPMDLQEAAGSDYLTYDDYMELIDELEGSSEVTKMLHFRYDEDEDQWYLTRDSAHKITGLYSSLYWRMPSVVEFTSEEGMALYESYMLDIAAYGSSDIPNNYDISGWCRGYYDDIVEAGEGPEVDEAFNTFVMAYMTYVMNSGYSIEEYGGPYSYILNGYAPSREDLYAALQTDEFLTEYYMNYLRGMHCGWSEDDVWNAQTVLLYETLAEAVPDADPEGYYFLCSVDETDGSLRMSEDMITETSYGIYEAEHGVGWDQTERCYEAAIETLYDAGEITRGMRDYLLNDLTPDNYGFSSDGDSVSSSGHPNQALGTYEQVPSWCTDGSLVYGYSYPDENGIWMHYSKEPGWLDTVGYYVDEDGIWITCYYDCSFDRGTTLIVDWWVNDEQVVDTEEIVIDADGTTEVEVFLPANVLIEGDGVYEMRLWEDDHSHVIAYVTLTREV